MFRNKSIWFLLFLVLFAGTVTAQIPDSAGVTPSDSYIFSAQGLEAPTGTLTFHVWYDNQVPVGAGLPVAIFINHGVLEHPSIFKSEITSSSGSYFYLLTGSNGTITADYIPGKNVIPHDSISTFMRVYRVDISDPSDSSTASTTGANLLNTYDEDFPYLVGPSEFDITVTGKHGDRYVFAHDELPQRESASVEIAVYDAKGRPAPRDVPLGLSIYHEDIWGTIQSDQILQTEYGSPDAGYYDFTYFYFLTNYEGKFYGTFLAPEEIYNGGSTGMYYQHTPWDDWYETYGVNYDTEAEAFADWEEDRTIPLDVETVRVEPDTGTISELSLAQGHLPVLVGPSKVTANTIGEMHGNNLLFTNKTKVERANVSMQVVDDLGRPVPAGVPVAVRNWIGVSSVFCGYRVGRIYSRGSFRTIYPADENCGIDGNAIVFTDASGQIHFLMEPPHVSLSNEYPHIGYDGEYPYCYPEMAFYYDDDAVWTYANFLTLDDNSVMPVFTSPDLASAYFKPSELGAWKISSLAKGTITDTRGREVPLGATIRAGVSAGTVMGNEYDLVETSVVKSGRVLIPYLSPTRQFDDDFFADLFLTKEVMDSRGPGDANQLGQASINLHGPAFNPNNESMTKIIFGKNITDIVADIPPIKMLGSMKNMAEQGQRAREAKLRLYRIASDPNTTDQELNDAIQDFRDEFGVVADEIANFIQDVPGTSFDPSLATGGGGMFGNLVQNGARQFVTDIAKDRLIDETKGLAVEYVEDKTGIDLFPGDSRVIDPNNFGRMASHHQNNDTAFYDIQLLSPLYKQTAESQMFQAYGLKFRVTGIHGGLVEDVVELNDRYPVPPFFLPSELGNDIAPNNTLISPGLIEVTSINANTNSFDAVAVGVMYANPLELLQMVSAETAYDTAETSLQWLDGNTVNLPVGTVQDSTSFFFLKMQTPAPVSAADSLVITHAYTFGSIDADSLIQHVDLLVSGTVILDTTTMFNEPSLTPMSLQPYQYNVQNQSWSQIGTISGYGQDTIAFEITETGIYGIGGQTNEMPPAQMLSSIDLTVDTASVFYGDTLYFHYQGFDQFDNPVAFLPTWTTSRGTISETGLFIADSVAEEVTVGIEDQVSGVDTSVTITVQSHPPMIAGMPDIQWSEDDSTQISLDQYVNDVDDPDAAMTWSAEIIGPAPEVLFAGSNFASATERHSLAQKRRFGNSHSVSHSTIVMDSIYVSIDNQTRTATLWSAQDYYGEEFEIEFTVADTSGMEAQNTISVSVTPVNDAPVLENLPDLFWDEDDSTTLALEDFTTDVDDNLPELQWDVTILSGEATRIRPSQKQSASPGSHHRNVVYTWENDQGGVKDIRGGNPLNTRDKQRESHQLTPQNPDTIYISINTQTHVATFTGTMNYTVEDIPAAFTATDTSGATGRDTLLMTINPVNDPPMLSDLPDTSFYEDEGLLISMHYWNQFVSDIDDSSAEMTWSFSSQDSVSITQFNDTLRFATPENWFGTDTFLTQVSDGQYEVTDSFIVTVLPVNDPPAAIELLSPSDEYYETDSTQISLEWSLSADVESDSLIYLVSLWDSTATLDTLVLADSNTFTLDLLSMPRETAIQWQVTVTDFSDSTASSNGPWTFRIAESVMIEDKLAAIPDEYTLLQNYPNPFNPTTTIRYGLPEAADVIISLYDIRGKRIRRIEKATQEAGWYEYQWNGTNAENKTVSTGVYFYRIQAGNFSEVKKMVYIK